jgi:hypothetical protein
VSQPGSSVAAATIPASEPQVFKKPRRVRWAWDAVANDVLLFVKDRLERNNNVTWKRNQTRRQACGRAGIFRFLGSRSTITAKFNYSKLNIVVGYHFS